MILLMSRRTSFMKTSALMISSTSILTTLITRSHKTTNPFIKMLQYQSLRCLSQPSQHFHMLNTSTTWTLSLLTSKPLTITVSLVSRRLTPRNLALSQVCTTRKSIRSRANLMLNLLISSVIVLRPSRTLRIRSLAKLRRLKRSTLRI